MKKQIPVLLLIAVIFAGGGFFGGMQYQKSKTVQNIRQQFGNSQFQRGSGSVNISGQPRQIGNRIGGRAIAGEILSQDDKSITVKMNDGSTKIVFLSDTTTISMATEGAKEDLKINTPVMVFGSENSDGSITATNIQLNPNMENLPAGGIGPTVGAQN